MKEDEVLALASKLGLNSNLVLKSISLINKTHPNLEKSLDETNLRDINSWEILENKISNKCHRFEVNCLYHAASITPSNISCYFLLHLGPPETRFQVLVHFATTRMNGQLGRMSFI